MFYYLVQNNENENPSAIYYRPSITNSWIKESPQQFLFIVIPHTTSVNPNVYPIDNNTEFYEKRAPQLTC